MPHSGTANVKQGKKQRKRVAPTQDRHALNRVAWMARLHISLITAMAVLMSVAGFAFFRHVAERSWTSPSHLQSALHGPDIDTTGLGNRMASGAAPSIPSVSDAIAESLAWQPPVATGNPSPIDRNSALEVATGDHVLGSQRAPITLMLFGDLHCRYTLHSFRVLSRRLQEQPSEYRLVWRQRPLDIHPQAPSAAITAERLALQYGETSFWRFVRAMSRLKGSASTSDVNAIVQALQIGSARMSDAAADSKAANRVERDRVIGLTYSIHATPTLFVNGLRFEGQASKQQLDEVIEEELDAVQALRDDSVPQAQVYSIRVDENLLDLVRD